MTLIHSGLKFIRTNAICFGIIQNAPVAIGLLLMAASAKIVSSIFKTGNRPRCTTELRRFSSFSTKFITKELVVIIDFITFATIN